MRLLGVCFAGTQWVGRVFLRWNRLEKLPFVPLGGTIAQARAAWDEPTSVKPAAGLPELITYTFRPSAFHDVVVEELRGSIVAIVFWSSHPAPRQDLAYLLRVYGEEVGWQEVERGYWYWRQDGQVRLWCSAAPAIGVATLAYFAARKDAQACAAAAR
jgi:hypothetical protein